MTSKDGEAPHFAQPIASDPGNEKSPQIRCGEVGDAAIMAELQSYVPGTVKEKRLVPKDRFHLAPDPLVDVHTCPSRQE